MRISLEETMLNIAMILSKRATCQKLAVGCVLTNWQGHIIGTGWNGVAKGQTHCTDTPCPGVLMPAGSDTCEAIHAETNALLQCHDVWKIDTCYVTHAPCMRCTKELLNTSCKVICFLDGTGMQPQAKHLWDRAGRKWHHCIGPIHEASYLSGF